MQDSQFNPKPTWVEARGNKNNKNSRTHKKDSKVKENNPITFITKVTEGTLFLYSKEQWFKLLRVTKMIVRCLITHNIISYYIILYTIILYVVHNSI